MAKKFLPVSTKDTMGSKGQAGLPQVLSLLIILFVVFTVGRILFNGTLLDPDTADGGVGVNGPSGTQGGNLQNSSLMNIGLYVMAGIIIIAAMASIVIRFF